MAKQSNQIEIRIFEGDQMTRAAADLFTEEADRSIRLNGQFSVALSGGSTPRALFQLLAQPPYKDQIEWDRIRFFWGDERSVPPSHADSNYRMAKENLLDHVTVQPDQVHRMEAESNDRTQAAREYERTLKTYLGRKNDGEGAFMDLVFLGMGNDGHTASLFPNTEALNAESQWVMPNFVPTMNTWRMTLTAPFINRSGLIVFLVKGADKADKVREVIEGPLQGTNLPSQLIQAKKGRVIWMLDKAAASLLTR